MMSDDVPRHIASIQRCGPSWKPSTSQRKLAILFGNNKYKKHARLSLSELTRCENDAMDMRKSLKKLGFEAHAYIDKNGSTMFNILQRFISKINANDLLVFYFSGHGGQSLGQNILYGIDGEFINITLQLSEIGAKKPYATVLLLDCCRLPSELGLTPMKDYHCIENLVVGFSCAEGQKSFGNKNKRNSCYTSHVLHYIERGGNVRKMLELAGAALRTEVESMKDFKSGKEKKPIAWCHSNFAEGHSLVLKHDTTTDEGAITTKMARMKVSHSDRSKQKDQTVVKKSKQLERKRVDIHVNDDHDTESYSSSSSSSFDIDFFDD